MRATAQIPMNFSGRGGARPGAGRPKKKDAGVSHLRRADLSGREPVHVTLSLAEHVYNLRTRRCFEVIREAFREAGIRPDFRVVALSIQGRHLHLVVEAASAEALARGIHGLKIRIARGLHRVMGQTGPVFDERYHQSVLSTPTQVRYALAYVLGNTVKHAAQVGRSLPPGYRDPYTVGYFGEQVLLPAGTEGMVAPPETWLLQHGWRKGADLSLPTAEQAATVESTPGQLDLPLLAIASNADTSSVPERTPEDGCSRAA
jgi:REP element-mobilizing transposase RayT